MKKLSLLVLAAAFFCSCQQTPRNTIQTEVPIYSITVSQPVKKSKKKRARKPRTELQITMVTVTGPEAREWDIFDRVDAVMKYNQMSIRDKEILFGTIAKTYNLLPKNNTLSSEAINTGIWKEVTDQGVDLSFGDDPADWHPYLMYIHPIVIAEMTNFYLLAKEGNISDAELNQWQKAGCNVINAGPDSITAAAMMARKDELAKAGIIITEENGRLSAYTVKVDWDRYRAEHN